MLKPIQNKILVRLRSRQETSKGGIVIPQRAQQAEEWGVAVAVGDEVKDIAADDIVFIKATQGTHYTEGGEDYIIIEDFRVICKLED